MNSTEKASQQPKHRACDECRARKLACSKEPDGCARCKREGVACHYSPQKQMGRPRKRPAPEKTTADIADPVPPINDVVPMDVDWSILDTNTLDNMSFMDILEMDFSQPSIQPVVTPEDLHIPPPKDTARQPKGGWHFGAGGLVDGLNFDNLPHSMPSQGPPTSTDPDQPPSLTPSVASPADQGSPPSPQPHANRPCACLANLYLALDGLQRLPGDVRGAMCAARYGARVAHDTMQCPSCSAPLVAVQDTRPPIQSLQNLLILGALLPVISNAYMQIVRMVDLEAEQARNGRRKLNFSIQQYGGLWGRVGEENKCQAGKLLQGEVDPMLWRQVVRALLRFDVYGMGGDGEGMRNTSCTMDRHLGLVDIIDQMEERSKKRHEQLAALDAKSTLEGLGCVPSTIFANPGTHQLHEKPTCLKIIEIAKNSVQGIVIA